MSSLWMSTDAVSQSCTILGDSTSCLSEQHIYTLEDAPASDETVEWQSSGTIIQEIPPHSVEIQFIEEGIRYVRATIRNSRGVETRSCQKTVGVSAEHFGRFRFTTDRLACVEEESHFSVSQFIFNVPEVVKVQWILDSATIQDSYNKELSYTFSTAGTYTLCARAYDQYCTSEPFCTEIIIKAPPPSPEIMLLGSGEDFPLNVCRGQNMMFSSSADLTQYHIKHIDTGSEWNYPNVSGLQGFSPSMSGTYRLTAWELDRSGICTSMPVEYEFTVSAEDVMQVECPSLVCLGDTVTYIALADCAKFHWTVSSEGEIIHGQESDSITVVWNNSPPVHDYGTVKVTPFMCADTLCTSPTIVYVPILSDSIQIKGPDLICDGLEEYSIAQKTGVSYSWKIEEVNRISGIDEITIDDSTSYSPNVYTGDFFGQFRLIISLEHPIIGCIYTEEKIIRVRPYSIDLMPTGLVCNGSEFTAEIQPQIINDEIFHWTYLNDSNTENNGKFKAVYEMDAPVRVDIETPYGRCSTERRIRGIQSPEFQALEGPTEICLNSIYHYTAHYRNADTIYWQIIDGTHDTLIQNQTMISYSWTSTGPYIIKLWAENISGSQSCISDTVTIEVKHEMSMQPRILGSMEVCSESSSTYSVMPDGGQSFQWKVAEPRYGSIIEGQGTDEITIQWLGSDSIAVVPVYVSTNYCGVILKDTLHVKISPFQPKLMLADSICPGEEVLLSLDINQAQSVKWYIDDDLVGNGNDLAYIFQEPGNHLISVQVTDPDGCPGVYSIMEMIQVKPAPFVRIQAEGVVCDTQCMLNDSVDLTLTILPSTDQPNIQWYYNGTIIPGEVEKTLRVIQEGKYSVIVEVNGCASGDAIKLECKSCPCPYPDTITQEIISVAVQPDNCGFANVRGKINPFNNNFPTQYWEFTNYNGKGSFIIPINVFSDLIQNDIGPYQVPGHHPFRLVSAYPCLDTICTDSEIICDQSVSGFIRIPLISDITYNFTCDTVGYILNLQDATRSIDPESALSREWTVDGITIGTTPNISQGIGSNETIEVCLEVTSAASDDYTCVKCMQITAPEIPEPVIHTTNQDSMSGCEQAPVTFTASVDSSRVLRYYWTFSDSSFSRQTEVTKTFSQPGNQVVSLEIETIDGCIREITDTITIYARPMDSLLLTSNVDYCETSALLSASGSGYNSYYWSNDSITYLPELEVYQSGMYSVEARTDKGCIIESNAVEVMLNDNFPDKIDGPTVICEGENQRLRVERGFNYDYQWTIIPAVSGIELDNYYLSLKGFKDGEYSITLEITPNNFPNVCGIFIHELTVQPAPELNITQDLILCNPFTSTICLEDMNDSTIYSWGININESSYNEELDTNCLVVSENNNYTIRAVNDNGCTSDTLITVVNEIDLSAFLSGCYTLCTEDIEEENILFPSIPGSYVYNIWEYRYYAYGEEVPGSNYSVIKNGNGFIPELYLSLPADSGKVTLYVETDSCSRESEPFCYDSEACVECEEGKTSGGASAAFCLYGDNYIYPTIRVGGYLSSVEGYQWCKGKSHIEWKGAEFENDNFLLNSLDQISGVLYIKDKDILKKKTVTGVVYLCDEKGNLCPFDFEMHLQDNMCTLPGMMCINWEFSLKGNYAYRKWYPLYPKINSSGNYVYKKGITLPFIIKKPECEITEYYVKVYAMGGFNSFLVFSNTWNNPTDTVPHTVFDNIEFTISQNEYAAIDNFTVAILNNCGDTCTYTLPKNSENRPLDMRDNGAAKTTVSIYPNPSRDILTVQVATDGRIKLWNISGKIMKEEAVSTGKNRFPIRIMQPGVYFLEYTTSAGKRMLRKVIIMK